MSSPMSELLFSPAPKVNSPSSPLGGVEGSEQGGDSFRQSFERETRGASPAKERPLAAEHRNTRGADARQPEAHESAENTDPAQKVGQNDAAHGDTPVSDEPAPEVGQTANGELNKGAAEEAVEEVVAEIDGAVEPALLSGTSAPEVVANAVPVPTTPLGTPAPVSSDGETVVATADLAEGAPLTAARPLVANKLAGLGDQAVADLPGQAVVPKAISQPVPDGKLVEVATNTAAQQLDAKPTEVVATAPRAFPLNMQTAASKGFKLDAWQFGQLDANAKAPSTELTDVGVKTPSPSPFHSTMANVMNAPAGEVAGARMQVPVNVTFGQPQWANMVAERSAWLFSQNINSAELILDPPEMGRMTVQIQVHNNDQASVTFTSANPNVRDALDQSSQRLREMLSEQGVDLVNVDVSDQEHAQDQGESAAGSGAAVASEDDGQPQDEPVSGIQVSLNSGVDYYV